MATVHMNPDNSQNLIVIITKNYYTLANPKEGLAMLEGHIYKTFDLELKELKEKLLYEGGLVEKAIDNAIKALLERDSELAKKVIEEDVLINDIEVEIDEFCLKLLALRQPAATGLTVYHNSD